MWAQQVRAGEPVGTRKKAQRGYLMLLAALEATAAPAATTPASGARRGPPKPATARTGEASRQRTNRTPHQVHCAPHLRPPDLRLPDLRPTDRLSRARFMAMKQWAGKAPATNMHNGALLALVHRSPPVRCAPSQAGAALVRLNVSQRRPTGCFGARYARL